MPMYLKPIEDLSSLHAFKSVLIAPCPGCPAMNLAMQNNKPYMQFLKSLLGTGAFNDYLRAMKDTLEKKGIHVEIYMSYIPIPFMCLFSQGQRKRMLKRAQKFEAIAVPGCDAATFNISDAVKSLNCKVIQTMEVTGIVAATATFGLPLNVYLNNSSSVSIAPPKRIA